MSKDAVESILDAATSLFAERGVSEVSLLEVARRAGVSSGLIIYHFKSKDNLLFIVSRMILSRIHRGALEAMHPDKAPLDAVHAFIDCLFAFAEERRDSAVFLARYDPFLRLDLSSFPAAELLVIKGQIIGLVLESVRRGVAEARFNPVPEAALGFLVWAVLLGVCHAYNQNTDVAELSNELKELLTYRLTGTLRGAARDFSGEHSNQEALR